jgi:hypothetical protein
MPELRRAESTEPLPSVPCPTCGVAVGKRPVLQSGAPRSESHVDWKSPATEAIGEEMNSPWSLRLINPLRQ